MIAPYYSDDHVTLHHGDCLEVLATLPDASVDSVVTDPPYGLEFMGKAWDSFKTGRAAKYAAGGSLDIEGMAAQSGKGGAGPSYVNRPAKRCAICGKQAWSGSPCRCDEPEWVMDNSPLHAFQEWCEAWATECLRVLKPGGHMLAFGGTRTWHRLAAAVEDAGFEIRDSIAWLYGSGFPKSLDVSKAIDKAAGAERGRYERAAFGATFSDDEGTTYGTALDSTPLTPDAERWQGWGTALKPAFEPIVVARKPLSGTVAANVLEHGTGALNIDGCRVAATDKAKFPAGVVSDTEDVYGNGAGRYADRPRGEDSNPAGRWPANVLLDDSQAAELDRQSGADSGGASRFFPTFRYEAKAPTSERPRVDGIAHPTVKPLDLMRWLVRLVTPPGGTVLEPFAGSGTTAEACVLEGFQCIAIEREPDYLPLIVSRLSKPMQLGLNFGDAS